MVNFNSLVTPVSRLRAIRAFVTLLNFCLGLGFAPSAFADRGFIKNFVIVNNTFYDTALQDFAGNPNFSGANLGNFSNSSTNPGSLVLNGAESETFKNVNSNVT